MKSISNSIFYCIGYIYFLYCLVFYENIFYFNYRFIYVLFRYIMNSSKVREWLDKKNFGFPCLSVKKTIIISTMTIISISFILFFYFQQQTEQSIKDNILAQQIQNQQDASRSLSLNMQSDLNLIMAKLQGLAYSSHLQSQDFQSNDTKNFIQNYYHQINSSSPVDRLFVVDDKGVAKVD